MGVIYLRVAAMRLYDDHEIYARGYPESHYVRAMCHGLHVMNILITHMIEIRLIPRTEQDEKLVQDGIQTLRNRI